MDMITFIEEPNARGFKNVHWVTAEGTYKSAPTRYADDVRINQYGIVKLFATLDRNGNEVEYFSYLDGSNL